LRLAAVDIGSNTTLLLIVEQEGQQFEVLSDEIYFTRLFENLQVLKTFSSNALLRLDKAFKSISENLNKHQVDKVAIVATSASRETKNKQQLFDLGKKHHLLAPIEIISPKREAELTFTGSLFGIGHSFSHPLVIDIGGGSTEFVSKTKSYSLKIGSCLLTENFLSHNPLTRLERINLNRFIVQKLNPVESFLKESFDAIIFAAGTPISLAFMDSQTSNSNQVHGKIMFPEQVNFWLEKLSQMSLSQRERISYLPTYRADVIVAGLSLLSQILKATNQKSFFVSATGVRYGLILEQMKKRY